MMRLLLILFALAWPAAAAEPAAVAAAADLRLALPPIVRAFAAESGQRVTVSFGSSGQMVQQTLNGAPFQLLLLADASHADRLAAAVPGVERRPYALGRLALVSRPGSGVKGLADLKAAIAAGRVRHFAIANPAHAPYGVAARAVLDRLGVKAPLVLGENVAQAMSFVASGAAEAGLVALPLALAANGQQATPLALAANGQQATPLALAANGDLRVVPVAPGLHPPLVQTLVLMPGASAAARGLADRLTGPKGRAALAKAGLGLP